MKNVKNPMAMQLKFSHEKRPKNGPDDRITHEKLHMLGFTMRNREKLVEIDNVEACGT